MRISKREGDEGGSRDDRRRSRERAREARKRREEIERRARELAAQAPAQTKSDQPTKDEPKKGTGKPEKAKVGDAAPKAKAEKDDKPAKARKPRRERASGESKPKRERGDRKPAQELARRFSLPGAKGPLRKVGRAVARGLTFIAFLVLWLAAQVERALATLVRLIGPRLRRLVDWLGRVATPPRAATVVVLAAGLAALASQAIDYRAIAIGEAAYADVSSLAQAPLTGQETPWGAHGPLVGLLAVVACVGALLGLLRGNRRAGQIALAAAAFALLLILAIDLPRVSDLGEADDEYAGTEGVLLKGFYIQLSSVLLLLFCAALPWIWRIPLPSLASLRSGAGTARAADATPPRPSASSARKAA